MRTLLTLLVGVIGLLLVPPVFSASSNSHADVLIEEALKPSPLGQNLERLTDAIGGRVSGTPAMDKAVQWGVEAFQAAGADRVHTENFTIPASWAEGATQMSVVAPEAFPVRAVSIAWGPALAPQHHVPIINIGEGKAEDFERAGNLEGKIVLVPQGELKTWDDLDAEYDKAREVIARAMRAKVLAIAFQSTRPYDLLYRHTHSERGEIEPFRW